MKHLSYAQIRALDKLHKDAFKSAYELQEGLNTLHALYDRGLAERKCEQGHLFFPRTAILFRLAPNESDKWYL